MALTTLVQNSLPTIEEPTHFENGLSLDVNGVQFPLQIGVPVSPIYTFKVIPAPASTTCIAPAQSFGSGSAGGNLSLQTSVQGAAPNITAKPIVYLGQQGMLLDCERGLTITFSVANTSPTIITVKGYDFRGIFAQWTSPSLGTGHLSISTIYPFTVITSISFSENPFSGNATPTISVGNSGYIGLPYFLNNPSFLMYSSWNNAPFASSAGGLVNYGHTWRTLNAANLESTPRGYAYVGTGAPTDGTRTMVVQYYVYGADSELNTEIKNSNQSSLKIGQIRHTTTSTDDNPKWVLPYLVSEDLTGLQIDPGIPTSSLTGPDGVFFKAYTAAVLS